MGDMTKFCMHVTFLLASVFLVGSTYAKAFTSYENDFKTHKVWVDISHLLIATDLVHKMIRSSAGTRKSTDDFTKKLDFYGHYRKAFDNVYRRTATLLFVLKLAYANKEGLGKELGQTLSRICSEMPGDRTFALSESLEEERKFLYKFADQAKIKAQDVALISSNIEIAFNVQDFYEQTCKRASDVKNW